MLNIACFGKLNLHRLQNKLELNVQNRLIMLSTDGRISGSGASISYIILMTSSIQAS